MLLNWQISELNHLKILVSLKCFFAIIIDILSTYNLCYWFIKESLAD